MRMALGLGKKWLCSICICLLHRNITNCFTIACHLCPGAALMQRFQTDTFVCTLGQDSVSQIAFQLIMFISLPLRVSNVEEHWDNKMDVFNYTFSLLGKTVKNCLCNFHCCHKFSGSTIYFWDLLCHVFVGHEDFDISSKFTGDKACTEESPELCNSPFPKI